jgi:broad specificity phosphatase PhoE
MQKAQLCIVFLLTFWSSALSFVVQAQSTVSTLKTFYQKQKNEPCIKLPEEHAGLPAQIILIRHGKPTINKKGWRNRTEAKQYVIAYDTVGVKLTDHRTLCQNSRLFDTVYHSTLRRAAHTAALLFGEQAVLVPDKRFIELERKVFAFPNMKMPLGFWVGTSRVLWLIGLNDKGIENKKDAKNRIRQNATFLAQKAISEKTVVLVAHGFHNKYLKRFLKKIGWKVVHNGGSDYLSVNILAKTYMRQQPIN